MNQQQWARSIAVGGADAKRITEDPVPSLRTDRRETGDRCDTADTAQGEVE